MEKRLTALRITALKKKGVYPDGGGLYLQLTIGADGLPRKSWFFRYTAPGLRKERLMGLGSLEAVSLADARLARDKARAVLQSGLDPIENRNVAREEAAIESAKSITFDQCAEAYIKAHRAAWKNPKHRQQWSNTLATYASPIFGALPVASVDTGFVMRVLEPIWTSKPETASRLRGRIESILAWATVRGHRANPNPAQLRNHLDHLLPKQSKVHRVKHHVAMDYRDVSAFMRSLETQPGLAAIALRLAILTACRTNEVLGAKWDEIDWPAKIWTIPAERMKAGQVHRVPLSPEVISILESLGKESAFLFPGNKRGKPLSNMSMLMLLRRMKVDATVHGFRSSFRDWCGNETNFPREIAEAALAHRSGDAVEAAYRRGDALEKRRLLMCDWAEYLS